MPRHSSCSPPIPRMMTMSEVQPDVSLPKTKVRTVRNSAAKIATANDRNPVKAAIAKLTEQPVLTEMEAWNLVKSKLSAYATHEDFLELPEEIRRAVGSASQLCQWALLDMESLPVIMSNFMRSYKTAVTEQRERERIPKDVLALMEGGGLHRLPGGDG